MAEDVANLQIKVDATGVDVATKSLKGLDQQSQKTDRATTKLSRSASGMTTSFIKGGLALGGITSGVLLLRQEMTRFVQSNVKFEKSMSAVKAVTRGTAEEMQALSKQAKQLGEGTIFSASQAAEGMKFLGQAGFETNEIIGAMPGLLDLAAAGSLDLANAADIASNIMSGFNINASESNRVADVLASIASSANTNVEQLGQGMKFVAPLASTLGISLEETAAAMGILSDAGIQADMAGTGLRQIIASLLATTPKAEAALERLGLTVEDVSPTTNTLTEIIEKLEEANIGATEAVEIFGRRGVSALTALTSKTPRLRELNEELANSAGRAKEMADTMTDNLSGAFTEFLSAVEGASIRLGEQSGLAGAAKSATKALTEFFQTIGRSTKEFEATKPIQDTIDQIAELEKRISSLSGTGGRMGNSLRRRLQTLKEVRDEFFEAQEKEAPLKAPVGEGPLTQEQAEIALKAQEEANIKKKEAEENSSKLNVTAGQKI